MKIMQVDKSQLISKIDMDLVKWDYKPGVCENIIIVWVGGVLPLKYKSRVLNQEMFDRMCN